MKRIALVVPGYEHSGGVRTVADFILEGLRETKYIPELYSLATSYRDPASRRLLAPGSWRTGPRMVEAEDAGRSFTRVGSDWAELEFMRFRPRSILTRELNQYDLVQMVCGIPAWGWVLRDCLPPVLMQVATLTAVERKRKKSLYRGVTGMWRRAMTGMISRLDERGFGVADAILVENYWMREMLEENGYAERTWFAPPGVDTEVFHPPREGDYDEEPEDNPLQRPYILSVGRFSDPRKDVDTLFRAYARLAERQEPTPELVLAGRTMPDREARELARELGIWDRVRLMQNITREELATLYRHARLFVLSSREEGLGIVLMEAMASGTPVVSTDCGGPDTLITSGENGLLAPVADPDALAEEMGRMLENPAWRKRLAENGLETVRSSFTLNEAINTYKTLYHRMLQ